MKTLVIFLLALVSATGSVFAQNLIAVQSGENATFYTNLDTALFYAKNGDDIYLPGGYIKANATTLKIDKAVNIIGVGYNPHTNPATENTIIQSTTIEIMPNVNGGSISGIYAKNARLLIQDNTSQITISRCLFNSIFFGSVSLPPSDILISETIVESTILANCNGVANLDLYPQNVSILNCIIGSQNEGYPLSSNGIWRGLTCYNNIIISAIGEFGGSGYIWFPVINQIENSVFANCIFINVGGNTQIGAINCTFRNCMSVPGIEKSIAYNCLFQIDINQTFIDPQNFIFNMKNDYRLQENSPGKNAGTDGTDIGIYGGRFPWKDGSLPANPHIESKFVNGTTDNNGNLNVKIKVAAQER